MKMDLEKGVLIVFEGIDGSGKSTQAKLLQRKLKQKGFDVVCFQEPSKSKWGREIKKKALLSDSLSPEEELELFLRDRRENVEKNLKPALDKKKVVILDRYYYSTISYQGARGINPEKIKSINEQFAPKADLVFILDIDPKIGLERIKDRKQKERLFEREDYLIKVRKIFKSFKENSIRCINALKPVEEIHAEIEKVVFEYLSQ